MLANLCVVAGNWNRLRRILPSAYWPALFALLFMGIGLILIVWQIMDKFDPVYWLSSNLPDSTWSAIGVSASVLTALWLALDATFRQVEFADKPGGGTT